MRAAKSIIAIAVLAFAGGLAVTNGAIQAQAANRVFELRTYAVAPGRLAALSNLFKQEARLFQAHGISIVGLWVPSDGSQAANSLVYLVAHASKDAVDKNWSAFYEDAQWKAAIAAAEKDGKLVTGVDRRFLSPLDFSPLK